MVSDIKGVLILGGREMLSSMSDGICVCVALVVVLMAAMGVVVLMAAMGMVVSMEMVGIVVLVIVVSIKHMSYGGGDSIVCIVCRSRGGRLCSSG